MPDEPTTPAATPTPLADAGDEDFVMDVLDDEPATLDTEPTAPDSDVGAPSTGEPAAATPTEGPATAEGEPTTAPLRDPDTGQFVAREPAEPVAPAAQPEGDVAPAVAAQPPAESPPEVLPPLQYRAGGRVLELEGSAVGEEGVFVPTAQVPELTRMLGQAHGARDNIAALQRKVQEAQQSGSQEVLQAQKTLAAIRDLMEKGPDAVAGWLDKLDQNWPIMEANARADALEARIKGQETEIGESRGRQLEERITPIVSDQLEASIASLGERPEFAGINREQMWERCSGALLNQIFVEGTEEELAALMPEGLVLTELENGRVLAFDPTVIESEFRYVASLSKAATEATDANKAAVATTTAPPTVSAGGVAPSAAPTEPPKFKSKDEMDEWLDSDKWKKDYPS